MNRPFATAPVALHVLLSFICLGAEAPAQRPHNATIQEYSRIVREAYSGDRALEVVAFVAPHWRLAGNQGFDASIRHVAKLLEEAGFVPEEEASPDAILSYRVESRSMRGPTWEPLDASLTIVGEAEPRALPV